MLREKYNIPACFVTGILHGSHSQGILQASRTRIQVLESLTPENMEHPRPRFLRVHLKFELEHATSGIYVTLQVKNRALNARLEHFTEFDHR